jgi:hypothetical protein
VQGDRRAADYSQSNLILILWSDRDKGALYEFRSDRPFVSYFSWKAIGFIRHLYYWCNFSFRELFPKTAMLTKLIPDERPEFVQFSQAIAPQLQSPELHEEYRLNSIDYHSYRKHRSSHLRESRIHFCV